MTTKQVLTKTKPFIMAKLLLGAVNVLASILLFAICALFIWLFKYNGAVTFIFITIWLGGTGAINYILMHYFGYLIKAGHIAVIAEVLATGKVPANQVNYGKSVVQKRFATANIYFVIDKLVSGAVRQIQRVVEKVGNAVDIVPGMNYITNILKFFVTISLGYIDECCLGYTFLKRKQGAFRSSCDGVVIYAQNWKPLLKNAGITMAKVIGLMIAAALIIFIPIGLLFNLMNLNMFVAFLLSLFIAYVVKFALLDSYIMIDMMKVYMSCAQKTELSFDLYGKLCKISTKFKELFDKGKSERRAPQGGDIAPSQRPRRAAEYADEGQDTYGRRQRYSEPQDEYEEPAPAPRRAARYSDEPEEYSDDYDEPAPRANKPVFCPQCGERNPPNTRFCQACGEQIDG